MLLSTIFEQLTIGELSNTPLANGLSNTGITTDKYPSIIAHINMAMLELYKEFPLKSSEVTIQQYDHIDMYYLRKEFAATNADSLASVKYIEDTTEYPFKGDVLVIDRVVDEDGQTLFLNDDTEYWSVHTPEFDCVQVPFANSANSMFVVYRATPDSIPISTTKIDEYHVALPQAMLQALLFFIAKRYYESLPSSQDSTNSAIDFGNKYQVQLQSLRNLKLYNTENPTNTKLDDRGFV